jgi:amphi-Trp domain-containing protein
MKDCKKKCKKDKKDKRGVAVSRQEAVTMLEELLNGLRAGSVAVPGSSEGDLLTIPDTVHLRFKIKNNDDGVKIALKLSWPDMAGTAATTSSEMNEQAEKRTDQPAA